MMGHNLGANGRPLPPVHGDGDNPCDALLSRQRFFSVGQIRHSDWRSFGSAFRGPVFRSLARKTHFEAVSSEDSSASRIFKGTADVSGDMAVHTLQTKQIIRASMAEAWAFFSNPRNLAKITPPELGFEVLTPDLLPQIQAGMMIAYRVRPLLGIPMTWLSEITLVEEGVRFIDEQRVGPYAVWHHEHAFHDLGDGRIEMHDRATYVLPFSPLGDLAHGILVKPQLAKIFAFREEAVRKLFPC